MNKCFLISYVDFYGIQNLLILCHFLNWGKIDVYNAVIKGSLPRVLQKEVHA